MKQKKIKLYSEQWCVINYYWATGSPNEITWADITIEVASLDFMTKLAAQV